MIVAIIGSRSFNNYELLKERCNYFLSSSYGYTIISGGAAGTDKLAERFASEMKIPITVYRADWQKHGRKAGMLRNAEMLENCTHVIAFWDGKSPGTANMIECAKYKHLRIVKI
ncbi:MAG: DUF2493 domain-containing protein [Lentimicrobium sp.]|nr:DUF2493 domain-containing protein [Lentimicrobium sp.]